MTQRRQAPSSWTEAFWALADQSGGAEACWPWLGTPQKRGYGAVRIAGQVFVASRVALEISLGRPIREGHVACHTCDNPPCVNPAHLFEGSQADNMYDAAAKGRLWQHAVSARLTSEEVQEALDLRRAGWSNARIGDRFGVSRESIRRLCAAMGETTVRVPIADDDRTAVS